MTCRRKAHLVAALAAVALFASTIAGGLLGYEAERPSVWLLEALAYDTIARVKTRAHWQTDVLAGFGLGTACGDAQLAPIFLD